MDTSGFVEENPDPPGLACGSFRLHSTESRLAEVALVDVLVDVPYQGAL